MWVPSRVVAIWKKYGYGYFRQTLHLMLICEAQNQCYWMRGLIADLFLFPSIWSYFFPLLSTGCMLGLGLVLAALCSSGQTDQHIHVTQTLDKLLLNLQDSSGQGRMLQEVPLCTQQVLLCLGRQKCNGAIKHFVLWVKVTITDKVSIDHPGQGFIDSKKKP